MAVTPPPISESMGSYKWLEWFRIVNRALGKATWSNIDFTASNITDILVREHNDLQSVDGGTAGQFFHLTTSEHTEIVAFFAATNITGAQAETLTNGSSADALHTHSAVGSHTIASHSDTTATGAELETLTNTSNADSLHSHKNFSGESSVKLPSYTVAGVPSASTEGAGATIFVSNGATGNPVLAFSDGTNWLRSDTLAAIASS